ncbi:MAG: YbaN family protein [Steroidobacteraceae bacterium]|jgi:uncharacterized membrane protein YbaN (DUF454 family)|nr:YbaN family protein [Steroidobacteraceae bacterium]
MTRPLYLALGVLSFATGFVGILLPLIPTVPLMLLAAFCFARSNPAWERRLLEDPRFGPHIRAWRTRGAIPRRGKWLATGLMGIGTLTALAFTDGPVQWLPAAIAVPVLAWCWTRPDA